MREAKRNAEKVADALIDTFPAQQRREETWSTLSSFDATHIYIPGMIIG